MKITEKNADSFAKVSQEYPPLSDEDLQKLNIDIIGSPVPTIQTHEIIQMIQSMKNRARSSTVPGDVPWKVVHHCRRQLGSPLKNIFERAIGWGEYPKIYKNRNCHTCPQKFSSVYT